MNITLGIGQYTEGLTGEKLVEAAQRLEELGYDSLWLPEISGREPFATCGYLLARTQRLRVCAGIANIYVRDANAAAQGRRTLEEFAPGRFSLGLGVSHPALVEPRGHTWQPPARAMAEYLRQLAEAPLSNPAPKAEAPLLIAAHGPKLLEIAASRADGALMYMQSVSAIAAARQIIGPDKQLHATVRCVYHDDRTVARDIARKALAFYINLPAYHRAWLTAGFNESDWAGGGSDRLIDTVCACGGLEVIRGYIAAVSEAGASHIILGPLDPEEPYDGVSAAPLQWDWRVLEALAG